MICRRCRLEARLQHRFQDPGYVVPQVALYLRSGNHEAICAARARWQLVSQITIGMPVCPSSFSTATTKVPTDCSGELWAPAMAVGRIPSSGINWLAESAAAPQRRLHAEESEDIPAELVESVC